MLLIFFYHFGWLFFFFFRTKVCSLKRVLQVCIRIYTDSQEDFFYGKSLENIEQQ